MRCAVVHRAAICSSRLAIDNSRTDDGRARPMGSAPSDDLRGRERRRGRTAASVTTSEQRVGSQAARLSSNSPNAIEVGERRCRETLLQSCVKDVGCIAPISAGAHDCWSKRLPIVPQCPPCRSRGESGVGPPTRFGSVSPHEHECCGELTGEERRDITATDCRNQQIPVKAWIRNHKEDLPWIPAMPRT